MDSSTTEKTTIWRRLRETFGPGALPRDDRGRMRLVVDNLALHLHPTKVPARSLSWTYTWGLGGLSALLIAVLGVTGIFLEMNYTPSPEQAYLDILALRTNVWFGELLRNLHHWSANLLAAVSVLHLLRVFFTGGHRQPRAFNWVMGVLMLLLVLGANFTGYLLPWDQLAFWAITVGTNLLTYIPFIGGWLSHALLGGPEVGAATLLNFYALHISLIPVALVGLMSLHFWRVRKDGGLTLPRKLKETPEPRVERVTTIPHLVRRELVFALAWLAILLFWAAFIPAPLEAIADPGVSPNPAKAPWYFMGLQELLLHFHPLVGAALIPGLAIAALALLPFYDDSPHNIGVYFRSARGRFLAMLALGLAPPLTAGWVLLDEYVLDWVAWLPTWPTWLSTGLLPLAVLALGLFGLDEVVRRALKADWEERVLFFFIFFFVVLVTLTIIGVFFRGPGMALVWPWNAAVVIH